MKFTCSAATLIEALQIVTKALPARTPNQILEGILVQTDMNDVILENEVDAGYTIENADDYTDDYTDGEIASLLRIGEDEAKHLHAQVIEKMKRNANII